MFEEETAQPTAVTFKEEGGAIMADETQPQVPSAPIESAPVTHGKKKLTAAQREQRRKAALAGGVQRRQQAVEKKAATETVFDLMPELDKLREHIKQAYSAERPNDRQSDQFLAAEFIENGFHTIRDCIFQKRAIPFDVEHHSMVDEDSELPYDKREYTFSYLDAVVHRMLEIATQITLTPELHQYLEKTRAHFLAYIETPKAVPYNWLGDIKAGYLLPPPPEPKRNGPVAGAKQAQREAEDIQKALDGALRANGKAYAGPQIYEHESPIEQEITATPPPLESTDIQATIRENQRRILLERQSLPAAVRNFLDKVE